jgi:hypothetical protein
MVKTGNGQMVPLRDIAVIQEKSVPGAGPAPAQTVKARDPLQTMAAAHQLIDSAPDDATPSAQRDLCKGPADTTLRDDVTVIQLPPSNYPDGSDDTKCYKSFVQEKVRGDLFRLADPR